jgi:predicted Zn-dependent peptidase
MPEIHTQTLDNGLTVLAEPHPGAQTLAMSLIIPAGAAHEPADRLGTSAVLAEMMYRGANGRSSREHSEALDRLGVQRGLSNALHTIGLGATLLPDRLDEALPLLLDMIRRPTLADDQFDPARDLSLQAIAALDDEPQRRAGIELRRRHLPSPLDRSTLGDAEHLRAMTADDVRTFWRRHAVAGGAILAFAGKLELDPLLQQVRDACGDWAGACPPVDPDQPAEGGHHHVPAESTQVHICIGHEAPPAGHGDEMLHRLSTAVLSGGMSGRLFTEVREKRGLCYAVSAGYSPMRNLGIRVAYAGTTTARAQETLDVLMHELDRLHDGVEADEFARARIGLKSRLVMQGESTNARASALTSDQLNVGRPRTLAELAEQLDAITRDDLNAYLTEHRPSEPTLVTVGSETLSM